MTPDEATELVDRVLRCLSLGLGLSGLLFQVPILMQVGIGLLAAVGVLRLDAWVDRGIARVKRKEARGGA